MMTYSEISQLENLYGDSFYIFKRNELENNISELRNSFQKFYSNFDIGYSYKTNYIPYACKVADKAGAFAEIVSEMELKIAQKLAINPEKIIYNGPNKSKESLTYCLLNNSIINIDNYSELELIEEILNLYPSKNFKIGIRLNLNLNDGFQSRFGFDPDDKNFTDILTKIESIPNLTLNGLHTHSTRPDKSIQSYLNRLEKLYFYYQKYFTNFNINYFDLGGGYYGKMDDNIRKQFGDIILPSFYDYGKALGEKMKKYFPDFSMKLFIEPGVALTVNVLDFVCKILDIKTIQNKNIATCTGSFHNIKPSGHSKNLTLEVISSQKSINKIFEFDICGYTCLENDILYRNYKNEIKVGDYCYFYNIGAYTLVFKPAFIKLSPSIISTENNQVILVKEPELFEETFNSYKFS